MEVKREEIIADPSTSQGISSLLCRICLKQGNIPIFIDNNNNLAEAIIIIGDVEVNESDDYPKHLCKYCHKQLLNAVLFRNKAQMSDKKLRSIKTEINPWPGNTDNNVKFENDCSNNTNNYKKPSVLETDTCDIESINHNISDQTLQGFPREPFKNTNKCRDNHPSCNVNKNGQRYYNLTVKSNTPKRKKTLKILMSRFNSKDTQNMLKINENKHTILLNALKTKPEHAKMKDCDFTPDKSKTAQESDEQRIMKLITILPKKNVDFTQQHIDTGLESADVNNTLKNETTHVDIKPSDDYFGDNAASEELNSLDIPIKHKTYNLICKECNIQYHLWRDYINHNVETHPERKKLQCTICLKDYSLSYIERHVFGHETDFMCDICGKKIMDSQNYSSHYRTHSTTDLPYKCSKCPYRGRSRQSLRSHRITHTGNKPHKCPECPERFLNTGNLKRHVYKHTGERPFKCEACNRGFFSKFELKKHIQYVHFGVREERTCKFCGMTFASRKICLEHLLQVHNISKLPGKRVADYMKYNLMENSKVVTLSKLHKT